MNPDPFPLALGLPLLIFLLIEDGDLPLELNQLIEQFASKNLEHPLPKVCHGLEVKQLRTTAPEQKSPFRMSQGILGDEVNNMAELSTFGLQKFLARRDVKKKITHRDGGATGTGHLFNPGDPCSTDLHRGPHFATFVPRFQQEPGNARNAGQSFTTESQGGDFHQVVSAVQFTGGMTFEGQQRVIRSHPFAIILDAHETFSTRLDLDLNVQRPCVDGILQELFHY